MADPGKTPDVIGNKEEAEEMEDSDLPMKGLTNEMMKNPEVLAVLQSRMSCVSGSPQAYIAGLPKAVKRRIKALKKIQLEHTYIESKFYEEVHALECRYAQLYGPLYEKRHLITVAKVEPTDEECDFPSDSEKDEKDIIDEMKKLNMESKENKENENKENSIPEDAKGIPSFWLTSLKNVDMLAEMIQEHDEPVLKHLIDIKVKYLESNPMGFVLEFFFEPNEYFTNTVLTKEYFLKPTPDTDDPFSFEGPEIHKCKGCVIDWKKGKNVTVKVIKKKQKHKARGAVRTVTKTVQNDSFFNFFNPPAAPDEEDQIDEESQAVLAADFDIGHFIKERIVPRAVLFFTGEAITDEDYDEEDEEEEEDDLDESGEEEEEDENEHNPQSQRNAKKQQQQQPPECKQQ